MSVIFNPFCDLNHNCFKNLTSFQATNYTNNKVYDRKGNIIGEKLELQPSNKNTSSGNYIDVGCTSNQQGTEKEEGYETSEVPNKKVKLSHEVEEVINVDKEER